MRPGVEVAQVRRRYARRIGSKLQRLAGPAAIDDVERQSLAHRHLGRTVRHRHRLCVRRCRPEEEHRSGRRTMPGTLACDRVSAMELLDHVLRRMGRHATACCRSRCWSASCSRISPRAARPLVAPLAILLLMLALVRTDWPRVRALLARPALALSCRRRCSPQCRWWSGRSGACCRSWPGLIAALCLSAMAPTIISAATTATFLRSTVRSPC